MLSQVLQFLIALYQQVPDLYDYIKYDVVHNRERIMPVAIPLFKHAWDLASFIVPREFGITPEEVLSNFLIIYFAPFTFVVLVLLWIVMNWVTNGCNTSHESFNGSPLQKTEIGKRICLKLNGDILQTLEDYVRTPNDTNTPKLKYYFSSER